MLQVTIATNENFTDNFQKFFANYHAIVLINNFFSNLIITHQYIIDKKYRLRNMHPFVN